MKIIITTPKKLEAERTALITKAVEIMKQQERSCKRYACRLAWLRNKIAKIEKQLGEM